jgi:hypothetical protein
MSGVANRCARCGTTTNGGQLYRFYYGVFVDDPETKPAPEGAAVAPGPQFRPRGSEEAYFCDCCLAEAAAWGDRIRSGLFLVLGLFALVVVGFLAWTSSPGLWGGLVALLIVAALGWAAYRRYRGLHAGLFGSDPAELRQAVSSDPKIQNMGDQWAIARRRQALQQEGANMFLTRSEIDFWSRS